MDEDRLKQRLRKYYAMRKKYGFGYDTNLILNFGKYKDRSLYEIARYHPYYLQWCKKKLMFFKTPKEVKHIHNASLDYYNTKNKTRTFWNKELKTLRDRADLLYRPFKKIE